MCWWADARNADATQRVRSELVRHIAASAEELDVFATELIVGELLANVYRYTPGPFCIEVRLDENREMSVVVHDAGDCMSDADLAARQKAATDAERGRGLQIIQAFGSKMHVERIPGVGCAIAVSLPARARDRYELGFCPEGGAGERQGLCARPARVVRRV